MKEGGVPEILLTASDLEIDANFASHNREPVITTVKGDKVVREYPTRSDIHEAILDYGITKDKGVS